MWLSLSDLPFRSPYHAKVRLFGAKLCNVIMLRGHTGFMTYLEASCLDMAPLKLTVIKYAKQPFHAVHLMLYIIYLCLLRKQDVREAFDHGSFLDLFLA